MCVDLYNCGRHINLYGRHINRLYRTGPSVRTCLVSNEILISFLFGDLAFVGIFTENDC
jgi:hypothetical protein